jgi:hypothetical protein
LEAVQTSTFHDYANLTVSSSMFLEHVNPMIEKARAVLRHEWENRTIDPAPGQPEYWLARDERVWMRLRDTLRERALADLGPAAPVAPA